MFKQAMKNYCVRNSELKNGGFFEKIKRAKIDGSGKKSKVKK